MQFNTTPPDVLFFLQLYFCFVFILKHNQNLLYVATKFNLFIKHL